MGLFSRKRRVAPVAPAAPTPQTQYNAAMTQAQTAGAGAEAEYLQRAKGFDASRSLRESVGGLYDQFVQGAGRKVNELRGGMVGAGRLGGGYGALDESEAVYDMGRDLNSRVATMAMDAEGMNLRNNEGLSQFGQNTTGRYTDMLSGSLDRQTAAANARQQKKGSIWGSLAGLAGSALGGPMGGMLGKAVGGLFKRGG